MKRSMLLPASIYLIEAVSSHINSYAIEKRILNKGHYVQDRFLHYLLFFHSKCYGYYDRECLDKELCREGFLFLPCNN
jgi:hypothetical protein